MYPLMCLYCTALFVADAAQYFWNKNDFCQNLNSIGVKNKLVDVVPINTSITCAEFDKSVSDDIRSIDNVRLLCREFDSLTYVWDYKKNIYGVTVLVELTSYNSTDADLHLIWPSKTNSSYVSVDDLKPGTEYAARFWVLIDHTARLITDTRVNCSTLDLVLDTRNSTPVDLRRLDLDRVRIPDAVRATQVSGVYERMNDSTLRTSLTWIPSKDLNCHYRIVYYPNDPKYFYGYLMEIDVNVTESFSTTLTNLRVDTDYKGTVQSYYRRTEPAIGSKELRFVFVTVPAIIDNKLSHRIDPVEQNTITAVFTKDWGNDVYDMTVSWKSPNASSQGVQYFTVKVLEESKNVSVVEGPQAYFCNVPLRDAIDFLVSVQAFSRARNSTETIQKFVKQELLEVIRNSYPWWTTAVLTASLAFCAAAIAVAKHAYLRRTSSAAEYVDRAAVDGCYARLLEDLRKDVHAWLDAEDVTVSDELLGRGHFGVVRKGALSTAGTEYTVAVKSLRDRPSGRDLEAFLGEILLMQKVGKHPNIVSMIGCCLDANKRCMLVVEYCPLGDLQTFLKKVSIKSWYANDFYVSRVDAAELTATAAKANDKVKSALDAGNPPSMAFNNCYLGYSEGDVFLTVYDLMRFASQAANGMMFLEKNRIVHRDLAARNVLLSDHQTIKICDFGLSRDVYEQNLYQKSNCGDPMPVKWLALESLKYRIYTTQSDVWSFGILLWEIMMLGECPYPDISASSLYEVLRRGYRMPRPTLCCYSLYELMLACWQPNPANRPKFGIIKDTIDGIMNNQYS